jgi:hypothetical protein
MQNENGDGCPRRAENECSKAADHPLGQ